MSEMPGQNPLGLSMYTLKKNEGQEGKAGVFWRWVPVGGEGHKIRVNMVDIFCIHVRTEE
jgi:hypothetical protein